MKLGEVHLNQEFYTALFGDQRYPKQSYMGHVYLNMPM